MKIQDQVTKSVEMMAPSFKAKAAVTGYVCKNKKIAILALTPNLTKTLTLALTLTLIPSQTQNLTQIPTIN